MTTETTDYTTLSLDKLRKLADSGPDAGTRNAAAKELKARIEGPTTGGNSHAVVLAKSAYGTPQPELQVTTSGRNGPRELLAVLHELAGQAQRMLLRTPELWTVEIRVDSATQGALCVELMDGSEPEAARAQALLRAIKPADGAKKRGRKPKDEAAEAAPKAAPAEVKAAPTETPKEAPKPPTEAPKGKSNGATAAASRA